MSAFTIRESAVGGSDILRLAITIHQGSVAFVAPGWFRPAGIRKVQAAIQFAGSDIIGTNPRRTTRATVGIAGTGRFGTSGATGIIQGGVAWAGAGTITHTGQRVAVGTVHLTGTGTLNATQHYVFVCEPGAAVTHVSESFAVTHITETMAVNQC